MNRCGSGHDPSVSDCSTAFSTEIAVRDEATRRKRYNQPPPSLRNCCIFVVIRRPNEQRKRPSLSQEGSNPFRDTTYTARERTWSPVADILSAPSDPLPCLNRHPCRFALQVFAPALHFKSSLGSDKTRAEHHKGTRLLLCPREDLNLHAITGTRP
jgi:hypothetical protein